MVSSNHNTLASTVHSRDVRLAGKVNKCAPNGGPAIVLTSGVTNLQRMCYEEDNHYRLKNIVTS